MDVTKNANDWFKGLSAASQSGSGNWFACGEYLVEILSMTRKVSQRPETSGHKLIISECRVVDTLVAHPQQGDFAASNRPGEICTIVCDLDGKFPSIELGKLRGQLEALVGRDGPKAVVGEGCDTPADPGGWMALAAQVTEPPGHLLAGGRMVVVARPVVTRARKSIAALTFRPAPAPAAAE